VGKATARVDGRTTWLDTDHRVVPAIVHGRVMIPIRFAAESLGGLAVWTAASRTITLTLPKQMVEVTDMAGNKVTVPRRVIRIATVSATATQLIFAVGAQDQLVAAKFGPAVKGKAMALIFPHMSQIPDAGDQNTANIESLLAARPDIVLTEAGSMLTAMRAAGLPAYAFSAEQPGQLVDGITRHGPADRPRAAGAEGRRPPELAHEDGHRCGGSRPGGTASPGVRGWFGHLQDIRRGLLPDVHGAERGRVSVSEGISGARLTSRRSRCWHGIPTSSS